TTLARKWSEDLLNGRWQGIPRPRGFFWWSFKDRTNADDFFESALHYMSGGKVDQSKLRSATNKMDFLAAMVLAMERESHCIFVLDGIDAVQHQQGNGYGDIKSEDLSQFVNYLSCFSHCLLTSNIPLIRYHNGVSYNLTRLSNIEGRE
ncbi:hypothetical protein, partial [Salmonella enterica]|uniref:hypothetical protein n=1 Tax=Salmonella enterica TaxID=28901 RepID=UPI0035264657